MSSDFVPECIQNDQEWIVFLAQLDAAKKQLKLSEGDKRKESLDFETSCDVCQTRLAQVYCAQDRAHFCSQCDVSHHMSSKLFMKHIRKPLFHSPFQFGFCIEHPSQMVECVCLTCGVLLCSHCLLVGLHASSSINHDIVSTIDALKQSVSPDGDARVNELRKQVTQNLDTLTRQRGSLMGNLSDVRESLEKRLQELHEKITCLADAKLAVLHSIRRQSLLQLLVVEWAEAFHVHERLCLPMGEWMRTQGRWFSEETKKWLLGDLVGISRNFQVPAWLKDKIFVEGGFEVRSYDASEVAKRSEVDRNKEDYENVGSWGGFSEKFTFKIPANDDLIYAVPKSDKIGLLNSIKKRDAGNRTREDQETQRILIEGNSVHDFLEKTVTALDETSFLIQDALPKPMLNNNSVFMSTSQPPLPVAPFPSTLSIKEVLIDGKFPYYNAIEMIKVAVSSERTKLIKLCVDMFSQDANNHIEFICAMIDDAVISAKIPSLIVSATSLVVPLTGYFLSRYPSEASFLDSYLKLVLGKSGISSDDEALVVTVSLIEAICKSNPRIPDNLEILFRMVVDGTSKHHSRQVAFIVGAELFAARIITPCLVKLAGFSPPRHISLVSKQLQRIGHADENSSDEQIRNCLLLLKEYVRDQIGKKYMLDGYNLSIESGKAVFEDAVKQISFYARKYGAI